jgi:hypothetical protein
LAYKFAKWTIFQVHDMRREPCLLYIKVMGRKINTEKMKLYQELIWGILATLTFILHAFPPECKSETKVNEKFITKQLTVKSNKNDGMSSNTDGENIPLIGIYKVNGKFVRCCGRRKWWGRIRMRIRIKRE